MLNDGTLTMTDSTISDNVAVLGGGVNNSGTFIMTRSTISGNGRGVRGGGLSNYGDATLINSTLSGNRASYGGGLFNGATLTIINNTISDNSASSSGGGGVYNRRGDLTLNRTLISGNSATSARGSSREINVAAGSIAANNFNLFGFNGNAGVVGFVPGANDIVPPVGVSVPEILDTLADNAPGTTQTHALVAGSPAVNAVGAGCPPPAVDQRGVTRSQGPACDIGSFELEIAAPQPPDGSCFGLPATIMGTELRDVLPGTSSPDVIQGLGGNDEISGLAGNDTICGGLGNDQMSGGADNDRLRGSGGRDRLNGGAGRDQCNGGPPRSGDTATRCETVRNVP